MAVVTLTALSGPGWRLSVTFDDVTDDLVSYRLQVSDGVSVEYELWRSSNRQPWRSGVVDGPLDETLEADGPVSNLSDIGHASLRGA